MDTMSFAILCKEELALLQKKKTTNTFTSPCELHRYQNTTDVGSVVSCSAGRGDMKESLSFPSKPP